MTLAALRVEAAEELGIPPWVLGQMPVWGLEPSWLLPLCFHCAPLGSASSWEAPCEALHAERHG